MVQTGDPTGTGKGGQSIWDAPFEDEIRTTLKVRRIRHSWSRLLTLCPSFVQFPSASSKVTPVCDAPHCGFKHRAALRGIAKSGALANARAEEGRLPYAAEISHEWAAG